MLPRLTISALLMVSLFIIGCESEQPTVTDSNQALLAPSQDMRLALVIDPNDDPVSAVIAPADAISKSPSFVAVDVAIYVADDAIIDQ